MSKFQIRVPKNRRAAMIAIANLSPEALEELHNVLLCEPIKCFDIELSERVAKKVTIIDHDIAKDIIQTAASIYAPFFSSQLNVDEFSRLISDAFIADQQSEEDVINKEVLAKNLSCILINKNLSLGAKANSILFESERTLTTSRIISDLRPVFSISGDKMEAAVITHTLRISYQPFSSDDSEGQFFVALDESDIDSLIDSLQRAKAKSQEIKSKLSATSVVIIDQD